DLTIKWSVAISDQTGASGPTTFDFEGDGKAEVVYADEGAVYIFDGLTGASKYEAPRSSRTITDNPVIVDVDNNGHADILLCMESTSSLLGMYGLIAYSNIKENWVGTRRVWNQHTYHITNISESGVVPAFEGKGWLDHNIYRSNVVYCEE
ncbi:VCBS repeat-containing protein, partial [Myxococcota bacterium]|nr:VCBS repeat-containing protein [Myxococcota bacterium]